MVRRPIISIVVLVGVIVLALWMQLNRVVPQSPFADAQTEFRYGVVQNGGAPEIPYWVWLTLPRIFPDHLPGPGGYASLNLAWDLGEELPIGFSKRTVG